MLTLAWPWVLLALPLPFVARALLPEARRLQEAGLLVPSFSGFEMLGDRSRAEQLLTISERRLHPRVAAGWTS